MFDYHDAPEQNVRQTNDFSNLIMSLALELCEAEELTLANAVRKAEADLADLLAFAEEWDRVAFLAGNDDAQPS
ncbi:MAG: hypothetical protein M3R24_36570 [Chloroflexota bacterium]|nr:hypothetical protein [Chloroflexota bacterium]